MRYLPKCDGGSLKYSQSLSPTFKTSLVLHQLVLGYLVPGMNATVARVNESVEAPKGRAGSKPSAQKLLHSKSSPSSAQKPAQPKTSNASKPSFASVTQGASRPSLVVSELTSPPQARGADMTTVDRRSPQDICKRLNAALSSSTHQVILSAVRWTPKNNLVVIAGPSTSGRPPQRSLTF